MKTMPAWVVITIFVSGMALLSGLLLALTGYDTPDYTGQCIDQGGRVVTVGDRSSCLVDGAVVGEWYE